MAARKSPTLTVIWLAVGESIPPHTSFSHNAAIPRLRRHTARIGEVAIQLIKITVKRIGRLRHVIKTEGALCLREQH